MFKSICTKHLLNLRLVYAAVCANGAPIRAMSACSDTVEADKDVDSSSDESDVSQAEVVCIDDSESSASEPSPTQHHFTRQAVQYLASAGPSQLHGDSPVGFSNCESTLGTKTFTVSGGVIHNKTDTSRQLFDKDVLLTMPLLQSAYYSMWSNSSKEHATRLQILKEEKGNSILHFIGMPIPEFL